MTSIWKRRVACAVLGLAILVSTPHGSFAADQIKVTFMVTNDLDTIDSGDLRGGFARLAALVDRERANSDYVVVVNAGDAISPSLLSGFDKGSHIIELLNEIPPDVFVPGNHEFDFGLEVFRQRISEARFPILAANIHETDGGAVHGIQPTRMFDFGGIKIGVVGVTAEDAYQKSSPGDLRIEEIHEPLRVHATALREQGADLIVAVAHANRERDMEIVRSRTADLVLSGDDHDLTVFFDGRTVLAESKSQAEMVVAVDVTIDIDDHDGDRRVSWYPAFRILDTATLEPDAAITAQVERYKRELSNMLDLELGTTDIELDSRRTTVRSGEAAIGNLIADALRIGTGADVAIINGGGIRGEKVYPAGTRLARRDILTELPFGNRTVVVEMSGAQIRAALENGVSDIENASGRFPHVSGMTFEADTRQPPGKRVIAVFVGGNPLDESLAYVVATNDFMLHGGDGYAVLGEGNTIVAPGDGKLMTSEVIAYFQAHGTMLSGPQGRIKLH